jgi:hypothetical protein
VPPSPLFNVREPRDQSSINGGAKLSVVFCQPYNMSGRRKTFAEGLP